MSDIEEPPAKMSKTETTPHEELEDMEEGQEEWLSEELLTEDEGELDKTDSNLDTSQEEVDGTLLEEDMQSREQSLDSQQVSQDTSRGNGTQEAAETSQDNIESQETIEQTLNNLENQSQGDTVKQVDNRRQNDKSDGNDTDDLLRLLGDNDEKMKKKVLVKTIDKDGRSRGLKKTRDYDGSSDEDEFILNRSTVQKLRVAKHALMRKPAAKAVPEGLSDGDSDDSDSLDEASTMNNIFSIKKKSNTASKSTTKPPYPGHHTKKIITHVNTKDKTTPHRVSLPHSRPTKPELKTIRNINNSGPVKTIIGTPIRTLQKNRERKLQPSEYEEIINEQEFLEEDDFDLNDDFVDHSDPEPRARDRQRIMRPEVMDEEVPTDGESQSDSDASMYDELPSSASEDMDDWFTLDIRAERASDYLPLLGDRAYELLTDEKHRVSNRLQSLRASVTELQSTGRGQAERLRRAAVTMAELDDMLKAA